MEGKLPFLYSLVTREEDGTLTVSVYRKFTHTDRYVPFEVPERCSPFLGEKSRECLHK